MEDCRIVVFRLTLDVPFESDYLIVIEKNQIIRYKKRSYQDGVCMALRIYGI